MNAQPNHDLTGRLDRWTGVATHRTARRVRQDVCQLLHRIRYGKYAEGDDAEAMRGMVCAILAEIQRKTGAPKHGLAAVLNVPASRISDMLVGKWPSRGLEVIDAFERAVLWMILGSTSKKHAVPLSPEEQQNFAYKRDAAQDIIDYFFPKDERDGNRIPPYFRPARRSWAAPYDRHEVSLAVEWLRREVKLEECWGIMLFVIPSVRAADALLLEELRRQVAFAGRECRQLTVTIAHPKDSNETSFAFIEKILNDPDEAFGKPPDKLIGRGVKFLPVESSPLFHPLIAFAVLAYEHVEKGTYMRLFILRPFASDRSQIPSSVEATETETQQFLKLLEDADVHMDLKNGEVTGPPAPDGHNI